jgi:hypothetical protein
VLQVRHRSVAKALLIFQQQILFINKNINGGITITLANIFVIPLTTYFRPDGPSSAETWEVA